MIIKNILPTLVVLFLSACDDCGGGKKGENPPLPEKTDATSSAKAEFKIEKIRKVFVHEPGEYSILVEDESKELISWKLDKGKNTHPFIQERVNNNWNTAKVFVRVFNDAQEDEGMWAIIRFYNEYWFEVELHVDTQNIEGGSFKYKSGKTNRTGSTHVLK